MGIVQLIHPLFYMMGNMVDHCLTYTRVPKLLDHPKWPFRIVPILIYPCLWLLYALNAPGGIWEGTKIFIAVQSVSSYHFLSIALSNHNQDECWGHGSDFSTTELATWHIRNSVDIRL